MVQEVLQTWWKPNMATHCCNPKSLTPNEFHYIFITEAIVTDNIRQLDTYLLLWDSILSTCQLVTHGHHHCCLVIVAVIVIIILITCTMVSIYSHRTCTSAGPCWWIGDHDDECMLEGTCDEYQLILWFDHLPQRNDVCRLVRY
jgi:hypothetical protein